MPRETAETRAARLLAERRVLITRVLPTSVRALVRGDSGELRTVTWDPRRGFRCDCPAIGIMPRTWREYVNEWEGDYLAHRCGRATVCLFTRPLQDRCPAREARIDYDHPEKPAHLPRGPGFGNGATNATQTAPSTPLRGTNSAVQDRPNGTNSAVPEHDSATPKARGF